MFTRNVTLVLFAVLLVFSFMSVFFALSSDSYLVMVGLSLLLNIIAVVRSDRGGIIRKKEARRAYEPARAFNGVQVVALVLLSMIQAGIGTYVILD